LEFQSKNTEELPIAIEFAYQEDNEIIIELSRRNRSICRSQLQGENYCFAITEIIRK
jgi:hypothetical protein